MSTTQISKPTEAESMEVAESSRETEWTHPSFLKELFLGSLRLDLLEGIDVGETPDRPEFVEFYEKFRRFLIDHADPVKIDETGEYPEEIVQGLRALGAFGMKIPKKYGGLGFTPLEYTKIMELLGRFDGNLTALLSAHQSIGVPQPVALFGSDELKEKYLPRCAKGAISAFALTENDVGSDPARLATTVVPSPDGDGYVINGTKLWCTNGTLAELLVVMALSPETKKISAFVVETDWEGVTVEHRCRFMGLKALANAVIRFDNVRVPKENLIGREGRGLKIALVTLNTGRLTLPAGTAGMAKECLEICRTWSNERVQWGRAIGKHEAIAHKISDMAATTFAMDAVADITARMATDKRFDIRLEAASAKEWNTVQAWKIVDETLQIRGGRGYETQGSLAARGEPGPGVERMMRDCRINLIFEGSSEIMHLFMAREAVDKHLQVAGDIIDPKKSLGAKLATLPKVAAFYATWYPTRWLGWGHWPNFGEYGPLASHMRFVDRKCRRLARTIFHGMIAHGPKLQYKQMFLFRLVDVANELFAMVAAMLRARRMLEKKDPNAEQAVALADQFCRNARKEVARSFTTVWRNDDNRKYKLARDVLEGRYAYLESDSKLNRD